MTMLNQEYDDLDEDIFSTLTERCKSTNIKITKKKTIDGRHVIQLDFPCGRETRPVVLTDLDSMTGILSVEFEQYSFLGSYGAICSYKKGTIEASLISHRPGAFSALASASNRPNGDRASLPNEETNIVAHDTKRTMSVSISEPSNEFSRINPYSSQVRSRTLKIDGATIAEHDQTLELLEKIANAFFFQLDLTYGISIGLAKDRRHRRFISRRPRVESAPSLEFPRYEYDPAPMSLYWYARQAIGMPLLQYLAYYQSIEYYFPVYSQVEAKRRIESILKNPQFRYDKDSDIGQILGVLKKGGVGFGDERSQLRSVINECVGADELRSFLTSSEDISEHFAKKKGNLTSKRLQIANPDADLRNDTADRIYEIRCKIVHTKASFGEPELELLLPFSPEADELSMDIELIMFIARKVLISASTPLKLPECIETI